MFIVEKDIQSKMSRIGAVGDTFNKRYELVRYLSSGAYGEVWEGKDIGDGDRKIAVKLFANTEYGIADYRDEILGYELLSEYPYCDPYIVCLFHHAISEIGPYIIQEHMTGDLSDFTGKGPDKPQKYRLKDPLSIILFMQQIAEGLRRIHESGTFHRDIKPANILYSVPGNFTGVDNLATRESYVNEPDHMRNDICIKFGDPGLICALDERKLSVVEDIEGNVTGGERCNISSATRTIAPYFDEFPSCAPLGTRLYLAPVFYWKFVTYYSKMRPDEFSEDEIEYATEYMNTITEEGITLNEDIEINEQLFYQANEVFGIGLIFRAALYGWENIINLHRAHKPEAIKRINYKSKPPNADLDNVINTVINDMTLVFNYKRRKSARDIVLYLNEEIRQALSPPVSPLTTRVIPEEGPLTTRVMPEEGPSTIEPYISSKRKRVPLIPRKTRPIGISAVRRRRKRRPPVRIGAKLRGPLGERGRKIKLKRTKEPEIVVKEEPLEEVGRLFVSDFGESVEIEPTVLKTLKEFSAKAVRPEEIPSSRVIRPEDIPLPETPLTSPISYGSPLEEDVPGLIVLYNGNTIIVDYTPFRRIIDVKDDLEDYLDIPKETQIISLGLRELGNYETLGELGIPANSEVRMSIAEEAEVVEELKPIIIVNAPDIGESFVVEYEPEKTIDDIKREIGNTIEVLPKQQRIYQTPEAIIGASTLKENKVYPGDTLSLAIKPCINVRNV